MILLFADDQRVYFSLIYFHGIKYSFYTFKAVVRFRGKIWQNFWVRFLYSRLTFKREIISHHFFLVKVVLTWTKIHQLLLVFVSFFSCVFFYFIFPVFNQPWSTLYDFLTSTQLDGRYIDYNSRLIKIFIGFNTWSNCPVTTISDI